jgi:hypothetical protein
MAVTTLDNAYISKDVYRDDLPRDVGGKTFIINGHSYIYCERGELAMALRQIETGTKPVHMPQDIHW